MVCGKGDGRYEKKLKIKLQRGKDEKVGKEKGENGIKNVVKRRVYVVSKKLNLKVVGRSIFSISDIRSV